MWSRLFLLACAMGLASSLLAHEVQEARFYRFIPNQGQFESPVLFKANVNSGALFLEKDAFVFHFVDRSPLQKAHLGQAAEAQLKGHAYRVTFAGSAASAWDKAQPSEEYYNFYLGNDPTRWASGVNAYREITYRELYPGTDLLIYSAEGQLKYDFRIQPGFSPDQIQQHYEGAETLSLKKGNLIIRTSVNTVTEQAPKAWQWIDGRKKEIPCEFVLEKNVLSYRFPKGYDTRYELIIDPVLVFGSFSGSTADNFGMTATYDNQGHLYAGGIVFNTGYPVTPGAYQGSGTANGSLYGVTDVGISKFSPDGSTLVYSTYIGGGTAGGGTETAHSLIVNAQDELLLFGITSSPDFPVTSGAYNTVFGGGSFIGFMSNGTYFDHGTDIYVSKFNAAGTALLASTFIGGSDNDGVSYNRNYLSGSNWTSNTDSLQFNYGDQFRGEIMVDDQGNCYVATTTRSADFPVVNAFQPVFGGVQDAVVFKLDPSLSTLMWSTFLGGNDKDAAYSIKVAQNQEVFVAGGTVSQNFPATAGSLHDTYQGGKADGFIARISADGSALLHATYIGTAAYDQVYFVELDRFGEVYIVGQTQGTQTYPVLNAAYSNPNSGQFITKLTPSLDAMIYSTVFGNGNNAINISPSAFMVDVCGNVYVSGWGANILQPVPLNGMPVTSDAFQPSNGDGFNFYLVVFARDLQSLLYATYFGGPLSREHVDGGTSRFDAHGIVYQSSCAGCSNNDDFPTTPGAWSTTNNSSNCNLGVFKFDFEITPKADFTTDRLDGCAPLTIQFTNTSSGSGEFLWDFGGNDTTSSDPDPVRTFTTPGTYIAYLIVEDPVCGLRDTAQKIITVHPPLELSVSDTTLCEVQNLVLAAASGGTANSFHWSSNGNFSDMLNASASDSTITVNLDETTVFYIQVSNAWCQLRDTVTVTVPVPVIALDSVAGICTGDTLVLTVQNLTPQYSLTYDWAPDSLLLAGEGSASVLVSPAVSAWISVTVTTIDGCTQRDSVWVEVTGPPTGVVEATADRYTIYAGESTMLHAFPPGYTYSWSPSGSLSNPSAGHPVASPEQTTVYTLTVSNGGCSLRDTVRIRVLDYVCGEPDVYIPNAFTPNGDGENDRLYVRGNLIDKMLFRVYNSWGEKVFETTDQQVGWDGIFRDRECDPAVFVYYLEITCIGGETYFKKGNVTLIR